MKIKKIVLISTCTLILIVIIVAVVSLLILKSRTNGIQDDYSYVYYDQKYSDPVYIEGIKTIKQDVSCGYAVLEMLSSWAGGNITEESLLESYGRVVTSTGQSFCDEMNKSIPEFSTRMKKWLKNSEFIDTIYEILSNGIPVPIEWAAESDGLWTLHYSIVIGADIPGDSIIIANPYGYIEDISFEEFLERTTFEAYTDMPLFLKLGFAFGVFEKNTLFEMNKK